MPDIKDPKDAASKSTAARVRDNQRRARERHKAYFQDLQRKVSEYEKRGVQATLEMQQAAREVAVENDRLRKLLRLKGVQDAEVAAFLGDFGKQWSDEPVTRKRKSGETHGDQVVSKARQLGAPTSTRALQPSPASKCCNGQTQCSDTNGDDVSSYKVLAESTSMSVVPSQAPAQRKNIDDLSSSTTMSCIAAAQIVADLQGHGDNERARQSLGCSDEGECTVKNTAVFQIMDRG